MVFFPIILFTGTFRRVATCSFKLGCDYPNDGNGPSLIKPLARADNRFF